MIESILIIPLCGLGKRFINSGYKKHKSLLAIDKVHMLERIIGKFPEKTVVYLITSLSIKKELDKDEYLNKRKNLKLLNFVIIEDHTLGPAYTIFKALKDLPKSKPTYISYCDITWSWDNYKFTKPNKDLKAAIFCHYGFHPHLVNNNYSAFCLPRDDSKNKLAQIKEKDSFTNDWMNEPLSIGLFYVSNLSLLESPLEEMVSSKEKVSNEYFPSLLFNKLIKKNYEVNLIPVCNFIHYGTPAQYEDFISWINFLKIKNIKNSFSELYSSFIFTSGKGSRMKEVSPKPKALIPLGNSNLLEMILKNLPLDDKKLCIVFNNLEVPLSFLKGNTSYINIKETSSQIDSLFESKKYLKITNNFFLCSCDCFGLFDQEIFNKMTKSKNYDIICFGFRPTLLQIKSKSNYSTLDFKDDLVNKIFVKKINHESDLGLAGFFWINSGLKITSVLRQFLKLDHQQKREIIIDDLIDYCISSKLSIGFIKLEKYFHLGTPDEFNEYKYWLKNYESLLKLN